MEKEKTQAELLRDKLELKRDNAYRKLTPEQLKQSDLLCEDYKKFLNTAKTERESAQYARKKAIENGFEEFSENKKYAPGSKIFYIHREKAAILCTVGTEPLENGVNIVVAHTDSPRLDLKPLPLYENLELALFKTHYYGGIKKYQWTCLPMSLHGVIYKRGGEKITVNIGEDENDPVFTITDLLPHLSKEQRSRTTDEAIRGEDLNLLVGSRPFAGDKESGLVKLNILNILYEKYGITEEDFLSSELELVPAYPARDLGFDRSMIGAYGHDDRVCGFAAISAALSVKNPVRTSVTVITDKEEIGSTGNTGCTSRYIENFISSLAASQNARAEVMYHNSICLSADVNVAVDPTYPDVCEGQNSAYLNNGIVVTKYTGAAGKSGTNDASAELLYKVRKLFNDSGVIWQTGELGKVDAGGGGTIAKYIAELDVEVVDVGVPMLSMHAPYEVVAKTDVYSAFVAYSAFFASAM